MIASSAAAAALSAGFRQDRPPLEQDETPKRLPGSIAASTWGVGQKIYSLL
jgi:hypothetical protein